MIKRKVSIQAAASSAVSNLSVDISAATDRANTALSGFRAAADELVAANDDLMTVKSTLEGIKQQISDQEASVDQLMSDNSAVAEKIYELITPKK